jgi:hypothetical protein
LEGAWTSTSTIQIYELFSLFLCPGYHPPVVYYFNFKSIIMGVYIRRELPRAIGQELLHVVTVTKFLPKALMTLTSCRLSRIQIGLVSYQLNQVFLMCVLHKGEKSVAGAFWRSA